MKLTNQMTWNAIAKHENDKITGKETAGYKNAGREIARHENAGHDNARYDCKTRKISYGNRLQYIAVNSFFSKQHKNTS